MARALLGSFAAALLACQSVASPRVHVGDAAALSSLAELGSCRSTAEVQTIDPAEPLVVLVHGCNSSQGRFASLSEVFALHGQQALCFRYDDRRRIGDVGHDLARALVRLTKQLAISELTLLGHSQGGLVARAAAVEVGESTLVTQSGIPAHLRLVTVSAPFNGIAAASDCGARWLHAISFGTTLAVCRAIAGAKWKDIHPGARSVRAPHRLSSQVMSHLEIRTDERNSCRKHASDGSCARSDFVFSLAEQANVRMDGDQRVTPDLVRAGHAEIVGDHELPPHKLLELLQRHQVLRPTPDDKRLALSALLARLF